MSKHLKSVAFLILAAVLVTAGYIETQQNLLGLNDDASMAFAALNADNQQTAPARTTTFTNGGAGTGVAAGTQASVQGTLGAITGWNLDANYGTAGTSTLEAIKEAFRTNNGGVPLPTNFTPIMAAAQITVTHGGGAGAIVPIPQPTVTSAQFDGTRPLDLNCMKFNGTAFASLPYVTADPGTTAPTVDSWALYDYNGGGAATPTFITSTTAMTAAQEIMLVLYITDNGTYDTNAGANTVQDPPALGVATSGLVGSSGSSGCVFNPAAGMSLEWLLLLLGPAVLMFRRKK